MMFRSFQRLPKITQNYPKLPKNYPLPGIEEGKKGKGRVIGNFGKLPGNYQVIQGNYPKLPITRVCRVRSYLVISNQDMRAHVYVYMFVCVEM